MRATLIIAGACLLISACASSANSHEPAPPLPPEASEPRTSVSVLARELRLASDYEPERDRIVLEGKPGRVVLYPGTTVMLVNGARIPGSGKVARWGGDYTVKTVDAQRIRHALDEDLARSRGHREKEGEGVAGRRRTTPDSSWNVPLRRTWKYIVIHHSATDSGSARSFDRSHKQRGWDGLGYHFVIGNGSGSGDGVVETGYRWTEQKTGAHAGRPSPNVNLLNEQGIGICLVGNFNDHKPTAKQEAALHRLIDYLTVRCRIPAGRVLVHRDIKGTECPGKHFPAQEFLSGTRDVPPAYR